MMVRPEPIACLITIINFRISLSFGQFSKSEQSSLDTVFDSISKTIFRKL